MDEISALIHYSTIALAVGVNSVGAGVGEGITSSAALDAINRQPRARNEITRTALVGMALIETAAILGVVIAIMLLVGPQEITNNRFVNIAEAGIAFSICVCGLVLGIVSSFPAQAACHAIARQPFFAPQIFRFMLITQSLLQSPVIFGFIVAFMIKFQAAAIPSLADSIRLIASGLAIGLGGIGPSIGLAIFARTACESVGINPHAYAKLFSFTLISQTIIETPIIFSFVISLALLFIGPIHGSDPLSFLQALTYIAAALSIGFGTLGAGISSGKTAAAACHQIALAPDLSNLISRVSLLAQGLIETGVIYAILISFTLIFLRLTP
jgi:F0F1-type ATP synthase membrane subunit c/vacuolar-type H+-ATPase subunit K